MACIKEVQESDRHAMSKFALPYLFQASVPRSKSMIISLFAWTTLLISATTSPQQITGNNSFGVAWRVIGSWRVAGNDRPISEGDAVQPGALLQPLGGANNHSVTILLPDGQRILYECFTSRDCERGFRVPSLYRTPSTLATDLLARVNAVLLKKDSEITSNQADSAVARDEAAALVGSDGHVEVAGLAAALSDGTYSYLVRPLSHGLLRQSRGTFEKHGQSVSLSMGSEGLFDVSIYDRSNAPRIDLLLAAVSPLRGTEVVKSFADVEALLKDWNEDYLGWPIHEIRRAYLRSVMLGIEAAPVRHVEVPRAASKAANVACEPRFEPPPGVFKGDTEVKLQCGTAGSTIHYTVDGSEPLESASTYQTPIVVKGTALTVKAFASAPGKKDSPVVTGIFRIGE